MISRWAVCPVLALSVACAGEEEQVPPGQAAAAATDDRGSVVFLGTSLTAGLGLDPAEAYPALIQQRIDAAGLPFVTVNAGVSGETSAGALQRIDWLLQRPVDVLVVETGANDGLRGIDPSALRSNLGGILDRARSRDPAPSLVVIGMEAPPNLGARYTSAFREVFSAVAEEHEATLVPFLLEGVAGVERLNQGDGIHPTAEGQRLMADLVWRALEPVLRERAARDRAAR